MNQNDQLIAADGLYKSYGRDAVIQNVSLILKPRNIVTIIGPNGSGKTTLLKLLLGLETPDKGSVTRKPGLRVGYVPQKLTIDPILPVNVEWFLKLSAHDSYQIAAIAKELAITELMNHTLSSLSGGEMQRVLMARALLCNPELLVLDEPAQGVDVAGQAALYELISRISRDHGCAVLMVSHDLHVVMSSTDQVICLNHHVCCHGHPHAVRDDPAFVALFGKHVAESLAIYTHHHDHNHV